MLIYISIFSKEWYGCTCHTFEVNSFQVNTCGNGGGADNFRGADYSGNTDNDGKADNGVSADNGGNVDNGKNTDNGRNADNDNCADNGNSADNGNCATVSSARFRYCYMNQAYLSRLFYERFRIV